MKTIKMLFISFLCVINLCVSSAQTTRGKTLLGVSSSLELSGVGNNLMSLGYTSYTTKSDIVSNIQSDSYNTTSFNIIPKVGYFLFNNLAIGLDLGAYISGSKYSTSKSNTTFLSAGPFIRYYLPKDKFLPYLEVGGSLGSSKNKETYDSGSTGIDSTTGISVFSGGIGITIPLQEWAAFDMLLGYSSLTAKAKDALNNERTVINTVGLKIGFIVFL